MSAAMSSILICGLISEYNSPEKVGARQIWQLLVHRATMSGFLISGYVPRFAEGGAQMAAWAAEGKLRFDEDIQIGLENAHAAFMRLFSGSNTGKLILKIA
jgi:NADPH-dependent curcumin reductase CurA